MTSKAHRIEIGALCTAAILISLWGIVWDITSGLITSGIDGIMLLLIALMIAGIFSLMFGHMLWQAGLIPFWKPEPAAPPAKAAAAAAKPAATAATPAATAATPKAPVAAPATVASTPAAAPTTPASAPKPAPATPPTPPEPTTK